MKIHEIDYTIIDACPQSPQIIFDDVLKRTPPPVKMPLV
jgi:hypothetical protein